MVEMLESVAQNFQIHQDLTIWAVLPREVVSLVVTTRSKIRFRIAVVLALSLSKVDSANSDLSILDSKPINNHLLQMEISHTTMCARIMPMMISISRRQYKFKSKAFHLDSPCLAKEALILLKISTST